MIRIETEQDPEVLRQVALLLDRENRKLHDRVAHLTRQLSQLRGDDAKGLQLELDALKEILSRRERALFADSSERRVHAHDKDQTTPHPARRGHGPRPQPQLPLIEKVHELADDQRRCDVCGGALKEWKGQFEESEEITVVERSFTVIKHRRKKYRCTCNAKVATAPGPVKLRPGARYSVPFAVEVAVAKYQDHLPLNRQVRQMAREGLNVDTQTLWDQIEAVAKHLQPSYEALKKRALDSELVHADETGWRFLGKNSKKRWWAWSVLGPDAVYYRIAESRSAEAASHLLNGYQGIVMADGYSAYGVLARGQPSFKLVHCWAHVRRKFIEIEDNYPVPCAEIVDLIGQLYAVERLVPSVHLSTIAQDKAEALRLRAELRDKRSRRIMSSIHKWVFQQHPLPQCGLAKAIAYMTGMWKGLTAFLEDPCIPLDNNAAERALRNVVLGRKNHYGSHSRRGTEVAALFYSLMESALLCGIEPKSYLLRAAFDAIEKPGTVTLPHNLTN
ncbi:MAG: IS66 family transposase [Acidiferrobacterales bacterium]